MSTIHFQLVTPEKTVLAKELTSLSCPTTLGQITVLPGHIPLVATLVPGELVAKNGPEESFINVSGGFVEVRPENQVVVLADAAEHHYESDEQRAQTAMERAKKALAERTVSGEDYAKVAASLEKSLMRLHITRKHAHRKAPLSGEQSLNP